MFTLYLGFAYLGFSYFLNFILKFFIFNFLKKLNDTELETVYLINMGLIFFLSKVSMFFIVISIFFRFLYYFI